jgi:hypothetical protein
MALSKGGKATKSCFMKGTSISLEKREVTVRPKVTRRQSKKGVFELHGEFYRTSGGIFEKMPAL